MSEPETDAELVAVQDKSGERWCGALTEASTGSLGVSVDGSPVVVSLRDVVAVGPRRQLLGVVPEDVVHPGLLGG